MTTPNGPTWNTLSLDQAHALRTAATRLATDFEGVFGTERPGLLVPLVGVGHVTLLRSPGARRPRGRQLARDPGAGRRGGLYRPVGL